MEVTWRGMVGVFWHVEAYPEQACCMRRDPSTWLQGGQLSHANPATVTGYHVSGLTTQTRHVCWGVTHPQSAFNGPDCQTTNKNIDLVYHGCDKVLTHSVNTNRIDLEQMQHYIQLGMHRVSPLMATTGEKLYCHNNRSWYYFWK